MHNELHQFERSLVGKRVLITGHTGFTGAWLCHWLDHIGASVHGIALAPITQPSLFEILGLADRIDHRLVDIRDAEATRRAIADMEPEVVIHLAAQPLVRRSYGNPGETFDINVMGTVNVLETCRHVTTVRAVVAITTDKVYENHEWPWPYRENDALGGDDPYSASKACAELVISSYQRTLNGLARGNGLPSLKVVAARGGNIIGGGDWSDDRLIPDFVRAVTSKRKLSIRNPGSTRPWQHVLALCHGYLVLADYLLGLEGEVREFAWNLGPEADSTRTVRQVLDRLTELWRDPGIEYAPAHLPEANMLMLDSSKIRAQLGWAPPWRLDDTLKNTVGWYRTYYESPTSIIEKTDDQLLGYRRAIASDIEQ